MWMAGRGGGSDSPPTSACTPRVSTSTTRSRPSRPAASTARPSVLMVTGAQQRPPTSVDDRQADSYDGHLGWAAVRRARALLRTAPPAAAPAALVQPSGGPPS